MKVTYNIAQNKFNVKFQTGYYPLPVGLENYYTKNETNLILENYYLKSETYSKTEIYNSLALKLDKGTYTGTAQDLYTNDQNLLQSLQNEQSTRYSADQVLENSKQTKLESVSGNTGVGKTDVSATEKLDVNGNVKANGFKTPTGTATQALTANGGTFDLNTKADLVGGKIPASQLPAYVDDVLEFANLASFPATGESGKIYIAIDTNITYRWTGTGYAEISASLALGETSSTAYRGDRGKIAYDHSQTIGNPHGTTKSDIGLGNVDNTSDLNKPISTATQTALNNKIDKGSLTSNDDSLLVEGENIEVQLSIYSEEFEQKTFNLTFTPINILGVYKNGIYLRTSEFILNLPKSITINNYNTNDIIIVQYQHLKTDI